jgi:hypothetical protein
MARMTQSNCKMQTQQARDGFLVAALRNEYTYLESGKSHQAQSDVGVNIHKYLNLPTVPNKIEKKYD